MTMIGSGPAEIPNSVSQGTFIPQHSPIQTWDWHVHDNWRISRRAPIDAPRVNAGVIQVASWSSKSGIKLQRIFRIRKVTPKGNAVLCRREAPLFPIQIVHLFFGKTLQAVAFLVNHLVQYPSTR
jgi:hypothetical protein